MIKDMETRLFFEDELRKYELILKQFEEDPTSNKSDKARIRAEIKRIKHIRAYIEKLEDK